jgi:cobalt-precorrin-5B (C1)-methyltransferase
MITSEVQAVCNHYGYKGGISVIVSIPAGAELANRTFNPKLGIEGGLSVLGTSGIVEPMSTQALIDSSVGASIRCRTRISQGHLTPGTYGVDFLKKRHITLMPRRSISNVIGKLWIHGP